MKYGIVGPYMVGTDRSHLLEWFKRIDSGPFSTIAAGERVVWPQIEQLAFLAAAAAVTERVALMSHVTLVAMHPPVLLAKKLASIDVISGGRLVVGVGTGGRPDDYRGASSSFENRWSRVDDNVATIRRIWAGELPWEGAEQSVGPPPVQPGGPPIFTSASGPKSIARAAKWADGWSASIMNADLDVMTREVQIHRDAWLDAGRHAPPYTTNNIWFALGKDAEELIGTVVTRYLKATSGTISAPTGRFDTLTTYGFDGVKRAIDNCAEAGFDELLFNPLTDDLAELDRLEALLSTC